jgi:hypothetical protein
MPAGAAELSIAQPVPGVPEPLAVKGYTAAAPSAGTVYLATFFTIPEVAANEKADDVFKGFLDQALSANGAVLKSEKPYTFEKYPGREFNIEMPAPPGTPPAAKAPVGKLKGGKAPAAKGPGGASTLAVYARIFLVQNRAYALQIVGPGLTPDSAEYKAFFDSFKLTSK